MNQTRGSNENSKPLPVTHLCRLAATACGVVLPLPGKPKLQSPVLPRQKKKIENKLTMFCRRNGRHTPDSKGWCPAQRLVLQWRGPCCLHRRKGVSST